MLLQGSNVFLVSVAVCVAEGRPLRELRKALLFPDLPLLYRRGENPLSRFAAQPAGQMLKQGAPIKVVSERLGHSTRTITLTTYAHVLPGMQEEATKNFDRALRKAMESQHLPVS